LTGQYGRQLNDNTRFNLNLGYLNLSQNQPTSLTNDTFNVTTGVTYQLGDGVSTSLNYAFLYRKSTQDGQDLRENSLTLSLSKQF
jgi:uncharacterized protein (PEP-CTERM system associated)